MADAPSSKKEKAHEGQLKRYEDAFGRWIAEGFPFLNSDQYARQHEKEQLEKLKKQVCRLPVPSILLSFIPLLCLRLPLSRLNSYVPPDYPAPQVRLTVCYRSSSRRNTTRSTRRTRWSTLAHKRELPYLKRIERYGHS